MMDYNSVVRLVDDFTDNDYKTRDSCPGSVFGHKLIPIARQVERRLFGRGKIKNLIFREQGTRNIWYKKSYCDVGVVAMGFSLSSMEMHQKALSMETYAEIFLSHQDRLIIPIGTSARDWMKRNDFELVE